jgi:hypothetical protein
MCSVGVRVFRKWNDVAIWLSTGGGSPAGISTRVGPWRRALNVSHGVGSVGSPSSGFHRRGPKTTSPAKAACCWGTRVAPATACKRFKTEISVMCWSWLSVLFRCFARIVSDELGNHSAIDGAWRYMVRCVVMRKYPPKSTLYEVSSGRASPQFLGRIGHDEA